MSILGHPLTQVMLVQGVQVLGQWIITRNSPKDEVADRVIQRLSELQEKMLQSAPHVVEQASRAVEVQPVPAKVQEAPKSTGAKVTEVHFPSIGYTVKFKGEEAPQNDIATACLPCTRAHLITVAGTLKEALRFAREGGVKHPEVVDRLDAAAEEITVMERFDLAPEKVANAPDSEKQALRGLIPKIRNVRQKLINDVNSVDDLEEVAVQAVELYKQARNAGAGGINWEEVEAQQKHKDVA